MPDPKRPRRPDPDPKPMFEVVEDPPPFEVVEDDPPPVAKPAPKLTAKPVAKSSAKPPVKAVRAKPAREEDDRDEDEPREKPKKKKRKREVVQPVDESEADRERKLRNFEWVVPGVLLVIGLVLAFVGAVGASKLGAGFTMVVLAVSLVVSVPLTIAALMAIGMVMGIEYGRLGPAVLKIAAITCVATGIMYVGAWLKLPGMIVFPISCFVTFALFMTQFDLDTWETNVSVGALNGLTFLAKLVLIAAVLAVAQKGGGKEGLDGGDDGGPVPSDTRPGGGGGPGFQPPVGDDDRDE